MQTKIEAFILTGSSFDFENRQIIKLYGQSERGSFAVTLDQFQNYFFKKSDTPTEFQSLDGSWVQKVTTKSQSELKNSKKELELQGIQTFESDIKALDRFLMDHRLFAQVSIEGDCELKNGLLSFINPVITPSQYYPKVKIMSFDIETGKDGSLLSIAYCFRSEMVKENFTFVIGAEKNTPEVTFVKNEKSLLVHFQKSIQRLDPDILTGWNVVGFDLRFLDKKSKELNTPLYIGRGSKPLSMFQSLRGEWLVNLEGRVVIDGPWSLKMNFFSFESFKLGSVAKDLLGFGKDIDEDDDHDKWDEIERRFREDKHALARYNVLDAVLVLDIFEKVHLIDLLLNRSLISGMLLERVGGSTASFDHFYLPDLHDRGMVALNVEDVNWGRQAKGGFVLNPIVGIHYNVLVLDFKSLYPTVIQTFLIDPLSRFKRKNKPHQTPVGISFSSVDHILPKKISELLELRSKAKKENNPQLSQAIKILMNSFYGVMGSNGCRFYHEDLPDAITGSGQWILKTVIEYLEQKGLKVLYGDTDSIFVQLISMDNYQAHGKNLVSDINQFLSRTLNESFNVTSKLEIQFDKFFKTLILTSIRGSEEGAKKRYAGLSIKEIDGVVKEEMVLTGMEYVRSDWSILARNFQYELIQRIFKNEDIESYIQETIKKLEARQLDDQLVLSKRLSKPLGEYVKNIPPHARAAKILFEETGILKKRPQFVMTLRGAIPIELKHDDIDYDYYLDRQLAPIADSILSLFGKSFAELKGPQLSLF